MEGLAPKTGYRSRVEPSAPRSQIPAHASIVGLATAVIVLAASWPLALHPATRVLGASQNDFYGIAWGLYQVARHLGQGHLPPLFFDEMSWPPGATLLVADLPEAILLAPVTLAFGPTVAFNLLQVAHHALAAAAAFACARVVGARPTAALVAAVAFAFSPALVSCTFNQNPDVTAWYLVPVAASLALTTRGPLRSTAAGLVAGLAFWCNAYGGLMAALCVLVLHPRRPLSRLALALTGAVIPGLGYALLAWSTIRATNAGILKGPRQDAFHGIATVPDLVKPPFHVMTQQFWDQSLFTHGSYLGITVLVLGVYGLVRARRHAWAVLAGAAVILSLGPVVVVTRTIHLPGIWILLDRLPGLDRLLLDHRFTVLAVLALGMGASLAANRHRWAGPVLAVLVGVDLLGWTGGWHLLKSQEPFSDGSCDLVRDLPPGPVIDFPPTHAELWLYAATCHGHVVAEGINNPIPLKLQKALHKAGPHPLPVLETFGYRYLVYHGEAPRADFGEFAELAHTAPDCEVSRNDHGVRVLDLTTCTLP